MHQGHGGGAGRAGMNPAEMAYFSSFASAPAQQLTSRMMQQAMAHAHPGVSGPMVMGQKGMVGMFGMPHMGMAGVQLPPAAALAPPHSGPVAAEAGLAGLSSTAGGMGPGTAFHAFHSHTHPFMHTGMPPFSRYGAPTGRFPEGTPANSFEVAWRTGVLPRPAALPTHEGAELAPPVSGAPGPAMGISGVPMGGRVMPPPPTAASLAAAPSPSPSGSGRQSGAEIAVASLLAGMGSSASHSSMSAPSQAKTLATPSLAAMQGPPMTMPGQAAAEGAGGAAAAPGAPPGVLSLAGLSAFDPTILDKFPVPDTQQSSDDETSQGVPRSVHPGVKWDRAKGMWRATLRTGDRKHLIGFFQDDDAAAKQLMQRSAEMMEPILLNLYKSMPMGMAAPPNGVPRLPPPTAPVPMSGFAATGLGPVGAGGMLPPAGVNPEVPVAPPITSKKKPGRTSRYRGVSWHKGSGKWQAQLTERDGKKVNIGRFANEREAAAAYDAKCIELSRPPIHGTSLAEQTAAITLVESKKRVARTSRYRGVYWHKALSKWRASIRSGGRHVNMGYFSNERDAAAAFDAKCIEVGRTPPNGTTEAEQNMAVEMCMLRAPKKQKNPDAYVDADDGSVPDGVTRDKVGRFRAEIEMGDGTSVLLLTTSRLREAEAAYDAAAMDLGRRPRFGTNATEQDTARKSRRGRVASALGLGVGSGGGGGSGGSSGSTNGSGGSRSGGVTRRGRRSGSSKPPAVPKPRRAYKTPRGSSVSKQRRRKRVRAESVSSLSSSGSSLSSDSDDDERFGPDRDTASSTSPSAGNTSSGSSGATRNSGDNTPNGSGFGALLSASGALAAGGAHAKKRAHVSSA